MSNKEINKRIIAYLAKYNPRKIGLFGSFARNEMTKGSDIDILIDFSKGVSLLQFVRMERELSELLGIKVDLVTGPSIRNPKLKKYIEQDLRIIYP